MLLQVWLRLSFSTLRNGRGIGHEIAGAPGRLAEYPRDRLHGVFGGAYTRPVF